MFETVEIIQDDKGVSTIWLNRAEKHNALSAQLIADLHAAADHLVNTNTRIAVLAARGKSFCAGGDLAWMREQFEADNGTRRREARKLAMMLKTLNDLPIPLIGRVHGNAFGGGVGLISVCDVVIAADTARFGLTETKLGLIPATISPYVMARMGETKARQVFMSARLFDAQEAISLNLLKAMVPEADLDRAIDAEITPYLFTSRDAVARAKKLTRSLGPPITDAIIDGTIEALIDCWASDAAKEGISAFFDKRKPNWDRT